MRVNHASTLTVGYFVSYLNLVMLSREINLKEATIYMEKEFLKGTLISMENQQKITINKQFKN